MGDPAIYTHLLTRHFGHQRAVDRLNLTVATGDILGIVGPAGAGKTTLLQLLSGRLLPSSGSARVLGYDVWTQSETIRACTLLLTPPHAVDRTIRCEEMLTAIQSSIHQTPLILLDEPMAAVDAVQAVDFYRQLESMARAAGATLVLTDGRMDRLTSICDSFGVFCGGKLLATAPAAEIHTRCVTRVEIRGRGFTHEIVALLRRRAYVSVATASYGYLCLYLLGNMRHYADSFSDSAPLVTLLVESGAEVEEVNRRLITLADLITSTSTTEQT
ncbi:MAG: ATP-binding cassette domain-containing protein [Caldilineaceae bacterium]|nr:ATP-binding cassette domain-containing protein [Caldilineaceae bacterium]